MKKFTFDIQRFATWTIGTTAYDSLQAAINAASTTSATTITLTSVSNAEYQDTTFPANKDITVDFGNFTFNDYGYTLTINSGATVTFTGGTIRNSTISNSGTLTVTGMTMSNNVTLTSQSNGSATIDGTSTVVISPGSSSYTYTVGSASIATGGSDGSGNLTVTTATDGSATISPAANGYFTDTTAKLTYTRAITSGVTFSYGTDGTISIGNFTETGSGSTHTNYFYIKDNSTNATTYYRVVGNSILQTNSTDNTKRIWNGDTISQSTTLTPAQLATDTNYTLAHPISNAALIFASGSLPSTPLDADSSVEVVDADNHATHYGTLKKSNGVYQLKQTSGDTALSSITISDGSTVELDAGYAGVEITVDTTTFKTTDSAAYTITSSSDITSIGGSTNISLNSGSVLTAEGTQTVAASSYNVYGYSGGTDGIVISTGAVGDIQVGESFNVNGTTYTRKEYGLTITDGGEEKVYVGSYDNDTHKAGIAVTLSNLNDDNFTKFSKFIQPADGVLTLGGDNTVNAVVSNVQPTDSAASNVKKFGELTVDTAGTYTLTETDGGDISAFPTNSGTAAIATISVAGGDTTIDKKLSDGRFIATAGGAIFTVQNVSGSTFTVNGTSTAPTVTNATEITLYAGSIVTDSNITQKITLNGTNQSITVNSGNTIEIAFTADKTFTVTGTQGDVFTLDGKQYSLINTDGMTFTVTDSGITISDLGTVDNDAFTATDTQNGSSINYSVRGVGFIKYESDAYQIWTPAEHQHTLTSNEVTTASLTSSDNWKDAATVNSAKAATIPTSTFGYLVGYDDFANLYGTFSSNGNVYTIDTVDSTDKLATVSVGSAVGVLSMGSGLDNVVIQSSNVTLAVTDPGTDSVYEVTLVSGSGGTATVSTGEQVSLIGGAVKSDSNVTVTALDNIFVAGSDTTLTISTDGSDATISALEADKTFKIGAQTYTQKEVVGLINESGNYLFSSKKDDIKLSDINNNDQWGSLVSAGEMVITATTPNVLVVDNKNTPATLYADYEANTKTLRKSNGGTDWDDNTTVSINNTNVNITADFTGKKIYGVQSKAAFTVNDNNVNFVVSDMQAGATIGSATDISQTGGIISLTSAAQVVSTDNGTVSAASGLTVVVSGDKTTVGAIDIKESFNVNGTTYTKEGVGLMDASNNLLLNTESATQIPVDSLSSGDWHKTDIVTSGNVLILPASTEETDWWILDNGKDTVYGSLTSDTDGVITVNRNNTSFAIRASVSGATFTTNETGSFTVKDGSSGASIGSQAEVVTLTGGIVALTDKNQSIVGGTYSINASDIDDSTDKLITVNMTSGTAVIGALDTGESFIVDGVTYTLQDNGRFQRDSDGKVWSGTTIDTDGGSIRASALMGNTWNNLAPITSGSDLTIDATKTSVVSSTGDAAFIHDVDSETKIYGTFKRMGDSSYSLSTDGKTSDAEFTSVTVTDAAPQVTFTNAFQGKTIIAGNTATITSTATSDFTLLYDGNVASVTGSNALTLTEGTLNLDSTNQANQTVTANGNTVKVSSGTVTVNYTAANGVTVGDINAANESVIVNGTTYTLTEGSGFTINIKDSVTSLNDIGTGDKFTIGNDSFINTTAGFFKTDDNGNAYMWTSSSDFNGASLADLTGTSSSYWTAIVATVDDELTINSDSKTSIVVDSTTDPSMIRGKLTKSGSTVTLDTYASTDTKPTAIIVDAATAVIKDEFNTIPITAKNSAVVRTETPTDSSKTLTFSTDSTTFRLNGTAYKMTGAGLTDTTNKKIWTVAGATSYVLPDSSTWSTLLTLDSAGKLDLTSQSAGDGSNVIVNSDSSTRMATLTYSADDKTYAFNKTTDAAVTTIALDKVTATVTTDFASTITALNGAVLTVNGSDYTSASNITVAATANNTSTLYAGTVTIAAGESVTADATIGVTDSSSSSITATAADGAWTQLGSLNRGDIFTVDGTTYQVWTTTRLVQLNDDGEIAKVFYDNTISGYKIDYPFGTASDVVQLDSDGILDLTTDLGIETAYVIPNGTPNSRVGELTYNSSTGYTLSSISGGNVKTLKGVTIGKNIPKFTTDIATTITTSDTGATYTVNGKGFTAQDTLTIATDSGSDTTAFLTGGTVTLDTSSDAVTARRTSGSVTKDETIAATNGTITVAVTDSTTTTIAELDSADTFTVDGTEYLASSIGLAISDKAKLLRGITDSVTTAQLGGTWLTVLAAEDGALAIDSSTISTTSGSVLVADLSTPAQAQTYGTLTKASGAYTLTLDTDSGDVAPTSITLTDVAATFPAECKSLPITAGGGTFTVTASSNFTVDATKTNLTFSGVTGINLSEGSVTLTATETTSVPTVAVKIYSVTVDNGTMTIGIDENDKTYIGDLAEDGEIFTVNEYSYIVNNKRLFYYDKETGEVSAQVDKGYDTDKNIFVIDDADVGEILAVDDDGTLDLTKSLTTNKTYKVYKSLSSPTDYLAKLDVANDGSFTLAEGDNPEEGYIKTVKLNSGANLTVKFTTQAQTESAGVITVNTVKYNGTGTGGITVDIADTDGKTSTLYAGTITLNSTYTSATADKTLTVNNGTFTATASNGTFNTIGSLDTGDSFTYDGTTYTQSDCGIVKDDQICESLAGDTVSINTLTSASTKWINFVAPDSGTLDLSGVSAKTLVYSLDSNDLPATKLGTVTISGTTYTFTSEDASTSATNITSVNIATGSKWVFDFVTQVTADAGIVTVNKQAYNASTEITLDTTASTSTIKDGTIILNSTYKSATDSAGNTLEYKSGDFTVTATNGAFKTIDSLDEGDSFIYNDTTYTQTACGMIKGGQICEDLAGDSVNVSDLDSATFVGFLYPVNGKLDLSSVTAGSNVYDKASPSTKLGTLTVTGTTFNFTSESSATSASNISTVNIAADTALTVDFVTQVTAAGSATVNGQSYTATSSITLDVPDTTGTVSTLTKGTVTLAQAGSVTITGGNTITATTTTDGLTVAVSGSTVTIGGITDGDVFTVGDDTYKYIGSALYKTDADNKDYIYSGNNFKNNSITLANLANDWAFLLEIDGTLTVAADTLDLNGSASLVSEDRTKIYGTLTKTGSNAYTLTASNDQLTALTVSGVSIEMDAYFKDIATFTAGNSTFSSIALKNNNNAFTLDATGTAPALDNVTSLTLTGGNVMGATNQKVTTSNRSITPTAVNGTMIIDSEEISGLVANDAFTVDDATAYKVLTIDNTAQVFNVTSPAIVTAGFTSGTLNFASKVETQALVPINGVTDLADMTDSTAVVVDSATAPTTQLGTVTKNGTAYTVDFAAQVKTPSTAPVTVNNVAYNGSSLTLDTTATSSTLNTGTITLDDTTYKSATADKTLTANSGTFNATASAGTFTTVTALAEGESFTYDGTTYTQTALGLMNAAGQIREDLTPDTTIDLADLATDWTDLLEVDNGVFTIDADTLTAAVPNARLVNKDHTKMYGRLTRTDAATYTLTDADETLTTLKVTGSTVTIDPDFRSVAVIANGTELSALTLGNTNLTYTLTATDTPTLSDNVTAFTLGQGSVIVNANQTVTTGENVLAATAGSVTVNATTISDIGTGDAFTLNGKAYKLLDNVGLFNATDSALVDDYADGSAPFGSNETQVVTPTDGIVQLADVTEAKAIVISDTTTSATKLGTIAKDDTTYTVDFAAQVKTPSTESVTVNGVTYNGTALTLDTTATTSTLTAGTVTLDNAESVTTTSGYTVTDAEGDGISVTASDSTVTLGELNAGDIFTVGSTEYVITDAALYRVVDGTEEIYNGTVDVLGEGAITVAQLAEDVWGGVEQVDDGIITIADSTLANGESKKLTNEDGSKVYGELSRDTDGKYTLTKTDDTSDDPTGITIDRVTAAIDSDFASVPVTTENADDSKTIFTATPVKDAETFTVDATGNAPAVTDVKAVELTAGSVVAAVNRPVTVNDSTVTPTAINGTMTIGTDAIGGLTTGDAFTIDSDNYSVINGIGLYNATDKTLVEDFTGGKFTFGSDETQVLTPNSSSQVDLTAMTGDKAYVFDSVTAPTKKLGNVTLSGTAYTVDFATPLKNSAGSFSVNGQGYTATSDVVIQSDGTTSTLTQGTVSLAVDGSVTTTGGTVIKADATSTDTSDDETPVLLLAADEDDSVAVTVTVNADGSISLGALSAGDVFTVNGTDTYKITTAGLISPDNKIWTGNKDYTDGLTLTELETASNWSEMLSAADGALTVKPSTLTDGDSVVVVDSTKNPTATYGTLTKDSDKYTLTKDNEDSTLSSLTDSGTIIDVDNDLAKVPITTVVSDGSEATFTVTPAGGTDYFTVDATGTVPYIDNAGAIEVLKGKITAADGITITAAEGSEDVDIAAGDGTHDIGGKTVKIDGMGTDEEGNKNTVDFGTDSDGNLNSISGLKKGATVTVDGETYTAPFDDATLKFNDNDGWYFDGYTLDEYTVTVDQSGNVSVNKGVQFSLVVSSGKTLDTGGTIKFAANTAKTPIIVINKGTNSLNISDHTGDALANNLGMTDGVKFSGDTTEIESLSDVAGATFTLDRDQVLTGNDATITGGADDTAILVASRGKSLDIDKAATVSAPSTTELLLGNASYNLNGVAVTTGADTEATLTVNGVTVNLADNDPLTFNGMTLGTGGTATFDDAGNVSLTSGATAANANGNTLTINGTVGIDDKTVTVAEATKVTATSNGLNVGDEFLTVTGDEDGYTINISSSSIIGLGDIGSSTGVTVGGLDDATVATDKQSSLTVDRTFAAPADVTYTVANGKLVSVTNAASIGGDFSGGLNVNGTNYTVKGGNATVESDGDIVTGAGTYTINGHTFTTSQPTTFTTNNASVTGARLDGDGTFAVHQDETNFDIDDDTLTFGKNRNPVTVGTASGIVATVNGVNGLIDGLTDATVFDVSTATVNGTPIDIDGDDVDINVVDGAIGTITDLNTGATVNSAPLLTVRSAENGTFTFVDDDYTIDDTDDGIVDFITDSNSRVVNIDGLSGLLSGAVDNVAVNGQPFASTSDDLIIETDGTDITAVIGLSSGDAIAGSLSKATMTLPEGSVTVNGAPFTLAGDSNGVELSDNGTVISGLAKDSTLTVGAADDYNINGQNFTAKAGQAYTVNREGVYAINESIMPITETTNADDILALGASSFYVADTMTGSQSFAFDSGNNVALIDSADAPTSIKTGTGTDSVVTRHGAQTTVDVEDGTPIIVTTNGKVTLDNYNDNADIQTFDYTDITAAVMNNDIKFGDGTMSIGDAVISFGDDNSSIGSTLTDIIGAAGDKKSVGFTHTNGGTLNTANSSDDYILKGNYAQNSSDTQKGNGSSITAGSGNDTVLIGANDTADAGAGSNQIYITDPTLRSDGATIALASGNNTVHGFNPGFTTASDAIRISDLASLEIGFGDSGLTMTSGNAQLMFDGLATPTVTVAATSDSLDVAAPYELQLTNGTATYNAAIAQDGKDLAVVNGTTADVFIGTDTTGLSFNEYTGAVAVNLGDNAGTIDGSAVQIYGVDKVALGSGNGTLIGAEDTNNTLIAGTGDGSIWSDSGNDLMRGNTSTDKTGTTDFFYAGGDGLDTITNFDFMASASDTSADELVILPDARVTSVDLSGNNVVIGFNDGTDDLLTIEDAKDTPFLVNGLITKVDDNIEFDGFTECYVGAGDRPTLTVGQGMGEVDIFLGDDEGTQYLGDIAVLDASAANGEMNFLAGSDTDNMIIGGTGENAIWGGDGFSNDTLVGGSGKNTFFFAQENGNDIIQNAHDGDVVDLTYLDADQFAAVEVTSDGVAIDLTDGSHLDVQSNAAVEYKLGDGNTYLVDHDAGEFNRKEN